MAKHFPDLGRLAYLLFFTWICHICVILFITHNTPFSLIDLLTQPPLCRQSLTLPALLPYFIYFIVWSWFLSILTPFIELAISDVVISCWTAFMPDFWHIHLFECITIYDSTWTHCTYYDKDCILPHFLFLFIAYVCVPPCTISFSIKLLIKSKTKPHKKRRQERGMKE